MTAEDGPSWDDIAGWYDDLVGGGSGPHELARATLLDLLPPPVGQTVLDVACGSGWPPGRWPPPARPGWWAWTRRPRCSSGPEPTPIRRVAERPATGAFASQQPLYAEVPIFLAARCHLT